jgi:uncharacterized protein YxeA
MKVIIFIIFLIVLVIVIIALAIKKDKKKANFVEEVYKQSAKHGAENVAKITSEKVEYTLKSQL